MLFCVLLVFVYFFVIFFFSSRRRHTRCALVTGVQTCALPILLSLLETLPVAATPVSPSPRFFVQWVIRHGGSQVDDFRGYAGQIGRASCRERVCQYV